MCLSVLFWFGLGVLGDGELFEIRSVCNQTHLKIIEIPLLFSFPSAGTVGVSHGDWFLSEKWNQIVFELKNRLLMK